MSTAEEQEELMKQIDNEWLAEFFAELSVLIASLKETTAALVPQLALDFTHMTYEESALLERQHEEIITKNERYMVQYRIQFSMCENLMDSDQIAQYRADEAEIAFEWARLLKAMEDGGKRNMNTR